MSAFRYVFTKFCHRLPAGLDPPCWCADVRGRIVFPSSPLDVVESISAVGLPSGLGQEVARFLALGVYCHLVLIASEGWEVWGWGGWKGVGGGVHFDAVSSAHRPCVTSRNAQQSWWRSGCPHLVLTTAGFRFLKTLGTASSLWKVFLLRPFILCSRLLSHQTS